MLDQAANLRKMVTELNLSPPITERNAKVITVVSGKGGVGKTSFSVNFAIALAKLGKKVLLIDADFAFSNVHIMLGVNPESNIATVVSGEAEVKDVIHECKSGISFVAGGSGSDELLNISAGSEARLMSQFAILDEGMDVIIFDSGAGLANTTLRLMGASDENILIITPEPTSIMDAYVVLKTAAQGENRPTIKLLFNKVSNEKEAESVDNSFRNIATKYLNYPLETMGYISKDEQMVNSILSLIPLMELSPRSIAARQIQAMAERYLNAESFNFKSEGFTGFFSKFIGMSR